MRTDKDDLMELRDAYVKYQTSDNPDDFDRFIRTCEKILR